jgi:MFS family permease
MFLHERGAYNTLYFTTYFGSLMIGHIISGAMALHSGRRNFWWLNVTILGATFASLMFFFPETMWHRVHLKELMTYKTGSSSPSDEKTAAHGLEGVDSEKATANNAPRCPLQ